MNAYKGLIKVLVAIFIAIISLNIINASPLQFQYYLLNPGLSTGDLTVQSLSENNKITAGSTELILDKYSMGKIYVGPDLTQGTVVTGTGPFTLGGEVDATDLPVPGVFVGTAFVVPHYRDAHTYYLLSPYGDAQATVTIGTVTTPVALIKGQVFTFDAGSDNTLSGIIQSNGPILVSHVAGNPLSMDAYPVVPASLEAWGVHSSNTIIGALEDNTTVTVYNADQKSERDNQSVTYVLNAGERQVVTFAAGKGKVADISQGQGNALHVVADKPIATIQVDDADGAEATAFFDKPYFGMRYGIPIDSQYVAVVCVEAETTVTLNDGINALITETCTSDGVYGGKVYFGAPDNGVSFSAGTYLESNRPVFITYEAALQNDEHNVTGHKDSYFVLDAQTQTDAIRILSLTDNNLIQYGAGNVLLNELESTVSSGYGFWPGEEITGTGPFTLGGGVDATDLPVPGIFTGTDFVVPHYRDSHIYYLLSPYGDTQVTITIGAITTPVALAKGQVFTFDAGSDNTLSGIIRSNRPVLVSHVAGAPSFMDAYPVPPASLEAWGVRNANAILGALEDNTAVTVYASDTQSTTYVLNAGDQQPIILGAFASKGKGVALHVVADKPISAIQVDDGDGMDAAAFFDTPYLSMIYALPLSSEYIAVVCTEANTTVTLNSSKYGVNSVFTKTCDSDGVYPGKVYFNAVEIYGTGSPYFSSGSTIISDKDIYLTYEDFSNKEEHNLLGFNLSLSGPQAPVLYSQSEIIRTSSFTINGLSQPNTTINIYVDGAAVQSVTTDGIGMYSAIVQLSEGNHQIYATQSDGTNESNPSNAIDVSYVPAGRLEYYFVDPQTALSAFTVVSMVDSNQIFIGDNQYNLDALQSVDVPAGSLKRGDVLWGLNAFSVGSNADSTDTPTPAILLGSQFVVPHVRDEHKYFLYSPEGEATVSVTIGGGVPKLITVPAKEVVIFEAGNLNNVAGVLTSDRPIAVTHQGNIGGISLQDVYAVPPATTELWGVKSTSAYLAAMQDNTNITVYSSALTQTAYTLNKGDLQAISIGNGASEGEGAALHIVADKPIATIQQDDSDGFESTAFWPSSYHRTEYALPIDSQYVAIICSQPDTIITLADHVASSFTQQTCSSTGENPGKAYFGSNVDGVNINANSIISADKPVYLYYETEVNNDEHNLYGFNIAPAPGSILTLDPAISPTNQNPYEIKGTASKANALLDIYVQGITQQQIISNLDGTFSAKIYLNDGLNDIYVTETDGVNITETSNVIQVQYDNIIDRNNLPTTITVDTVWTAGITQEPYIIPATLTVAPGANLILERGVKVLFDNSTSLQINGSLIVNGTEDQPVHFTYSDISNASPGVWYGIYVNTDVTTFALNHAVIEYAADGIVFNDVGNVGVVTNSLITNNRNGIYILGNSSPIISAGNTIANNWHGLLLNNGTCSQLPIISGNNIFNNGSGFRSNYRNNSSCTDPNIVLDVTRNWWGTTNVYDIAYGISSPYFQSNYTPFLDAEGGNEVTGNYISTNIATNFVIAAGEIYDILDEVAVLQGATLTIEKGAVLNFVSGSGLVIDGGMEVNGLLSAQVRFTTRDTSPYKSWKGIRYTDTVTSAIVDNAIIEHAYTCLSFEDSGAVGIVTNTTLRNCDTGLNIWKNSSPQIIGGNVIESNSVGVLVSGSSGLAGSDPEPVITNNAIYTNGVNYRANGFGDPSIQLNAKENWWGEIDTHQIPYYIDDYNDDSCSTICSQPVVNYGPFRDSNNESLIDGNFINGPMTTDLVLDDVTKPYYVTGNIVIPNGLTLIIQPGVEMKFLYNNAIDVYGNLIINGAPSARVILTSSKEVPAKNNWPGVRVKSGGNVTIDYAMIEYASIGIEFQSGSSGSVSNSIAQYHTTGIKISGTSSPTITTNNIIAQNTYGVDLVSLDGSNPTPVISGNQIYSNSPYNVNVNAFIGGDTVTVDVRGNYWGSTDPIEIALTMKQGGTAYPVIDFSDYLEGTGGSAGDPNELQVCPVVRATDDSDFTDSYPEDNIEWIGSNFTSVQEIEKAFNNARLIDNSVFQYLKMPSQEEWDAMSVQQQGLYLINSERQARGIKPYEGVSQNVVDVAQIYADFVRTNNQVIGHYNDGQSPEERLDVDIAIRDNRDASIRPENGYEIHGSIPVPLDTESVTRAVYWWTYYDKFPLFGDAWGHRVTILQTGLYENSGETYKEGLIGFGVSAGEYNPDSISPADSGVVVYINAFDPSPTWDHSTTQSVNTDFAQQCNDNIIIDAYDLSLPLDLVKALEITPTDMFLTSGTTGQLQIIATYQNDTQQDITSAVNLVADNLSIVSLNAGTVTAERNGSVYVSARTNGVISNKILITVGNPTDTSSLNGTNAEDNIAYIPDNATIDSYDPKAFSVFTGLVKDKLGVPLVDVDVSIHNKPEYGSVRTDSTGRFIFATEAGKQNFVYKKSGYLTIHRTKVSASNEWTVVDEVRMLAVDTKESAIDLNATTPQTHKSTVVTDEFGSRSTTLVFNGITSATVTSADGSQRSLGDFLVRATEYKLPQSMPAKLPKETAFTYCADLQIPSLRDDETVTFDKPVVMYVDNFLNFNIGEIVPIGYYDRQTGEWVASDNGIVVKLLDTDNNGLVDGLDFTGDNIADDINLNGSTTDEVAGIESYAVGSTYWRGSFNHFTPWDFNWPYVPPGDAIDPGNFTAESSNENKEQKELECTGSYVKPETQAFHEDIPITGTNLTLHYSSQRTEGYKHKFNVQVSGATVPTSMLEMMVKLEIGGNVFEQSFTPAANKEAEFIWDGNDPTGKRIKGIANGLISIGYKYNAEYSSAGVATTPAELAQFESAWAKVGGNTTGTSGRDDFISWSSSPVAVQNTFDNQIADGWSISNHHQSSPIGNIYKGDGEVIDIEKTSLVLKTGVKISRHVGDDGYYQKGGSDIDYSINSNGTLNDKVTGLEWQYTNNPERFIDKSDAINYCSAATFTTDATGWRLPTTKEVVYTIDKSASSQNNPIYQFEALQYWQQGLLNPENKQIPVICVRGEELDVRYVAGLKRDDTNEVVIDSENGLMWQDDATTTSITLDWVSSIDHCENLEHAGYNNWRLPNINELAYTLPNSTFVNQTTLPAGAWSPSSSSRNPYWSSTPNLEVANNSWAIESVGYSWHQFSNADLYNIRCVRDNIQSARSPYRFDELGRHNETVDLNSGVTLTTFNYNLNNQLVSMTDRFGDTALINRDLITGKVLSITSADGYVTQLTVDANNDLSRVDYADTTNYQFIYSGTSSLLTSKTDPNSNIFLHQFDADGRTIQTSDAEGGIWNFFSTRQGNSSALYGYDTAELNTYQTLRTILDNGDVNKATTLFDGTVLTNLNQADDLKQTQQSCAVTTVIDKVIDSKTKEPIPSLITITQPSGLQNVTQLTKTYGQDGADTTQQTLTVNLNGKTSSVFTDTKTGITTATSAKNRTTTLNVDPATLLLQSSQTPGLFGTAYTYDTRGRQTGITTGTRTTTFTYNPVSKGDVTFITADDGKKTEFEYDALGRVKTIIYPDLHRSENIYDNNGNMKTLVVPTPANHTFTYSAVDKVKTETTPKDGVITEVTQYDYDRERNLKQITLPSNKIITNTYSNGLLDFTTTPEGIIDYAYTCNGKVSSISEGTESISYGYDGSLLKDITYAGSLNKVINQTYNTDFNINALVYSGLSTSFAYDNDGLLTSTNGYTITRNAQNGLPETLANGTLLQTRAFNGYGEAETVTTKVSNQNVYDYTLSYNDLGKITSKTETLDNGTVNTYVYSYDDRRRLDTVTKNGALIEDYGYDANGNRTLQTNSARGITAQSASYNLGDQLQSDGATSYEYDSDSYLSKKTTAAGITTYQYSSQGRLLQVQAPGKTITYQHNALGNRVAKLVDGVVTEKYLWLDKTTLLATYDVTDTLLQRYQYTDGNTPNSFTQGGQTYYIVTDHLGSPRAITDSSGAIVKKLDYDSFGNVISDSNTSISIPFGFAGGLYDKDTGLTRFGFRDYDADTGRWTARDPIGFSGGDTNLYGYVFSDPVTFVDPFGLEAWVNAFPNSQGGFNFTAHDNTPGSAVITGNFNNNTFNSNQIRPGSYNVTPRPTLPNTLSNWFFNRNKNAGNPTISNTGDWNTIQYSNGDITKGAQFHEGRNGGSSGVSQACMVSNGETNNKLNQLFTKNYDNGGVTITVYPSGFQGI